MAIDYYHRHTVRLVGNRDLEEMLIWLEPGTDKERLIATLTPDPPSEASVIVCKRPV